MNLNFETSNRFFATQGGTSERSSARAAGVIDGRSIAAAHATARWSNRAQHWATANALSRDAANFIGLVLGYSKTKFCK